MYFWYKLHTCYVQQDLNYLNKKFYTSDKGENSEMHHRTLE